MVYLPTKLGDFVRVNVGVHIPAPWFAYGKDIQCTCGKSKRCIETRGRNRLISLALQPMCHCHSFQKHSEVHPASNVSNDQSFGQVEKKHSNTHMLHLMCWLFLTASCLCRCNFAPSSGSMSHMLNLVPMG